MFLKFLIPFDRTVLRSPLSANLALKALKARVEPNSPRIFETRNTDNFHGVINDPGFRIKRIIGYRNSISLPFQIIEFK